MLLPGTVATLTLDTEEARAAVAAARSGDGRVVLVPQVEGRTRPRRRDRPGRAGRPAADRRGGGHPPGRAAGPCSAAEVVSERSGLWQEVEPLADGRPSPRVEALARELRVVLEEVAELRRSRRLPEILRTTGEAGALADAVTAWSEASNDHRLTVLEATEVGARVELVAGLGQGPPGRARR